MISKTLLAEAASNPDLEIKEPSVELKFDQEGNLL